MLDYFFVYYLFDYNQHRPKLRQKILYYAGTKRTNTFKIVQKILIECLPI